MNKNQIESTDLPLKNNLTFTYATSFVIVALVIIASGGGLLFKTSFYPTDELLQSFWSNDIVNLFIGLPILLGSMWLARRGKLIGLLFWPGALFYLLYVYIIYVFSMPLNIAFFIYMWLVNLSAYTILGLLASIDGRVVKNRLGESVAERVCGGILAGLGTLFFFRAGFVLVDAIINQSEVPAGELALNVADFLIAPALVIGGVLIWRRKALGYLTGLGLLFQASMLFIGLIVILILRPFISAEKFIFIDVLIIFVMGMVSFVPLFLFVRGATLQRKFSSMKD